MCRLFDLHQLITRTSRSYSYCAFPFQMTLRWERLYLQTIARNLSSVGRSDFGSVSRRDRWYWSSGASGVLGALRIMPLFIGRCSKIISSCILDWQVYRLADNDPFPCRSVSLFRLSTLTCLTMSALVLLNLFHSIMFPTIHHHILEHLQLRRRHGFPARLWARRASR
jgi:hypothetical protein